MFPSREILPKPPGGLKDGTNAIPLGSSSRFEVQTRNRQLQPETGRLSPANKLEGREAQAESREAGLGFKRLGGLLEE